MDNAKVKPSFNPSRQVLGNVLPLETPFTIVFDSGDVCNFRCSYCFRSNPTDFDCGEYNHNTRMSWDVFQRAADQIVGFSGAPKTISLSNHGEPLCNPLLPKMISYIKSTGSSSLISIHTNASLLDEKTAEALVDAGLDRMVVSLQGMTSEEYRTTCGINLDYELFLRRLRYFYSIKKHTDICIKIIDVALKHPEDKFYSLFSQFSDRVFIEKAVPIWDEETIGVGSMNKYGEYYPTVQCCPLVFHTLVVTSEGVILPCTRLTPPLSLGTIFETTLIDAWHSHEREKFLKTMLKRGRSACQVCNGCYIAQNSIYAREDIIDGFQEKILERMECVHE